MNKKHLALCASPEWAEAISRWIVPWTLEGLTLGPRMIEFGPGPGLTTDVLASISSNLTAVELDLDLASDLAERFSGRPGVRVICADAASTGLPDASVDAVVCLTMLHHVPTPDHQDAIFREARRLLVPGGMFAGSDSLDGPDFRELHEGDICSPVAPESVESRLRGAGFTTVTVDVNDWAVRFRAAY